MNQHLDSILNKEISRKEFLALVGAGALSIMGIGALLKNLSNILGQKTGDSGASLPYGNSAYGGVKQPANFLN